METGAVNELAADPPSAELVRSARTGDSAAFDSLVLNHYSMVYSIAVAHLYDKEGAQDLTQEVFLRAYLLLDQLRGGCSFGAWVARIARNLAIDWNRRGAAASRLLPMISLEEKVMDMPDERKRDAREQISESQDSEALREAMGKLPVQWREVVLMHYMEQMSHRQIAQQMNIDASTVTRILQKALAAMRGTLQSVVQTELVAARVPHHSRQRTLACIAAVAALSASQKTVLASTAAQALIAAEHSAAAGSSAGATGISWLASLWTWFISGGKTAVAMKSACTIGAATAVIAGGAVLLHDGPAPAPSTAPEQTAASSPIVPLIDPSSSVLVATLPPPSVPPISATQASVPVDNARLLASLLYLNSDGLPITAQQYVLSYPDDAVKSWTLPSASEPGLPDGQISINIMDVSARAEQPRDDLHARVAELPYFRVETNLEWESTVDQSKSQSLLKSYGATGAFRHSWSSKHRLLYMIQLVSPDDPLANVPFAQFVGQRWSDIGGALMHYEKDFPALRERWSTYAKLNLPQEPIPSIWSEANYLARLAEVGARPHQRGSVLLGGREFLDVETGKVIQRSVLSFGWPADADLRWDEEKRRWTSRADSSVRLVSLDRNNSLLDLLEAARAQLPQLPSSTARSSREGIEHHYPAILVRTRTGKIAVINAHGQSSGSKGSKTQFRMFWIENKEQHDDPE